MSPFWKYTSSNTLANDFVTAETSPVSFQSTPADPIIKRVETVGKVQPHVRAKLVDNDGNVVDVGKPGELIVAGYLLQKGCVVAHFITAETGDSMALGPISDTGMT